MTANREFQSDDRTKRLNGNLILYEAKAHLELLELVLTSLKASVNKSDDPLVPEDAHHPALRCTLEVIRRKQERARFNKIHNTIAETIFYYMNYSVSDNYLNEVIDTDQEIKSGFFDTLSVDNIIDEDITDAIRTLSNSRSLGPDNIPSYVVKGCANEYKEETGSELQKLEDEKLNWTLEERWNSFREALYKKTTKICAIRKTITPTKRTKWWNTEVRETVKEHSKIRKKNQRSW
ncbi:hypothetical protein ILUMI_04415 [Ignelater luminosus]|uniref:Uncharacterized protein n=1 Tax=Ignelater luminosus TaxID=2038154 RepID=A0A8K0GJL6_IGNLU|nr:hypothetical protein ILUMI_04415 [Ignelater luminosus]